MNVNTSTWMCVPVCVNMCIHVYMCVHWVCVCVCMNMCLGVYVHMGIHVYVCVCVSPKTAFIKSCHSIKI